MLLVVGLGNPGPRYKLKSHNNAQAAVQKFADYFDFPSFKLNSKFKAKLSQKIIDAQEIVLALPVTYMNESGQAVKLLVSSIPAKSLRFSEASQYPVSKLWIVHDDIDLPLGKIRLSQNRSSAGHRGVESIIKHLATQNFVRFRLGIKTAAAKKTPSEKFVLQKFSSDEQKTAQDTIKLAIEAIKFSLEYDLDKAMNRYN